MAISKTLIEETPRMTQEIVTLFPAQGQWSEDDYFALPDSNHIVELSEGVLIMPPPPTDFHQGVNGKFYIYLDRFVSQQKLGIVRIAPLPVRLWEGKIREPDVLFLANEHKERRGEQFYGPPDLVMEVISPSTRKTDRRDKYQEYAQAGVSEYWLIDPRAKTVEVYFLEEGVYVSVGSYRVGEDAKSKLLNGFTVNLKKLFAD